jgi:hypothetical protein
MSVHTSERICTDKGYCFFAFFEAGDWARITTTMEGSENEEFLFCEAFNDGNCCLLDECKFRPLPVGDVIGKT